MHGFAHSFTAVLLVTLSLMSAGAGNQPNPIQIGMAKSFVTDRAKSTVDIAADDFKKVLKQATGLDGQLTTKHDAFEVADKLSKKQLDFGILYAHEFAWVRKKHPDLQPLLIAANKHHVERAYLIVHKNSSAKTIADLRGKTLDLPIGTNEPCRLFIAKLCAENAQKTPALFFDAIKKSASQTDALDGVARGNVQATVVDTPFLEFYKDVKRAVFAKNLKILQQSEVFPPAVIVFKQGTVDEATLDPFRDGLLKAHTLDLGRDLMKTWNMDAFELVPKDYSKRLTELLKAYPPR